MAARKLGGVEFKPGAPGPISDANNLSLVATDTQSVAKLKAGESITAKIALKDGRNMRLKTSIQGPRPTVALIGKSVQSNAGSGGVITLTDPAELASGGTLTFSLRAKTRTVFLKPAVSRSRPSRAASARSLPEPKT